MKSRLEQSVMLDHPAGCLEIVLDTDFEETAAGINSLSFSASFSVSLRVSLVRAILTSLVSANIQASHVAYVSAVSYVWDVQCA